jgi:hypothetical protein
MKTIEEKSFSTESHLKEIIFNLKKIFPDQVEALLPQAKAARKESSTDSQMNLPKILQLPSFDQKFIHSSIVFLKDNFSLLREYSYETTEIMDQLISRKIYSEQMLESNKRKHCLSFLSNEIKMLLKCSVFELDSELINLPILDDSETIVLSVAIGKAYSNSWTMILADHFKTISQFSDSHLSANPLSSSSLDHTEHEDGDVTSKEEEEGVNRSYRDYKIITRETEIGGEGFPSSMSISINGISAIILDDPLPHLCLYSFIEEINDYYFQQNNLLKRSFYLVKYFLRNEIFPLLSEEKVTEEKDNGETKGKSSNSSVAAEDFLPEEMLWIMVLCVFNKYFRFIEDPLECLLFFLMEFSWSSAPNNNSLSFVSIFGAFEIPLSSFSSSNAVPIPVPQENYFLPVQLIEKYWHLFYSKGSVLLEGKQRKKAVFVNQSLQSSGGEMSFQPDVMFLSLPNDGNKPAWEYKNRFLAVNPLTNQILSSKTILTNPMDASLSTIFQQGIVLFMKLFKYAEERIPLLFDEVKTPVHEFIFNRSFRNQPAISLFSSSSSSISMFSALSPLGNNR